MERRILFKLGFAYTFCRLFRKSIYGNNLNNFKTPKGQNCSTRARRLC